MQSACNGKNVTCSTVEHTNNPAYELKSLVVFLEKLDIRHYGCGSIELVKTTLYITMLTNYGDIPMKIKIVIHEADEGGYWAEVPAIPGCVTQGENLKELITNVYDAVEGCLSVDMSDVKLGKTDSIMELVV